MGEEKGTGYFFSERPTARMLEARSAVNSTRTNQKAVFVRVKRDGYVVRDCLNRHRPFGKADRQAEMASMFGLGSRLRPRGHPRIEKKSNLSPF